MDNWNLQYEVIDSRTKITNTDELDEFSDVVTIQRDHVRLKNELIECYTHCGAGDMNSHSLEFLGSHLSHDHDTYAQLCSMCYLRNH